MQDHEFPIAEQRGRDLGFNSFSKYVVDLISQDLKNAVKEGKIKEEKLTPQQELDQIVSEMAHIGQGLGIKLKIMRRIVRKELKLHAKKESDVEQIIKAIWSYMASHDGMIEYKDKFIGIDRNDVDQYGKLGVLHFRKLALSQPIVV